MPPFFRTIKLAVAASLAFAVALALHNDVAPVLAPLTALLVSQATVHKSISAGGRRLFAVVAGVLVASFLSTVIGLSWWGIGLTVLIALGIGTMLRLGDLLLEVPVSAMLVLAVNGQHAFAITRVYETLIGAAVGVLVNVVLVPPVYVQTAGDQLRQLGKQMAGVLGHVAVDLPKRWDEAQARRWQSAAWQLDSALQAAREAVSESEDSLRLNPRQRYVRQADASLRSGLAALEHAAVLIRGLMAALLDRVREDAPPPSDEVRAELAMVLDDAGRAIEAFAEIVGADVTSPWGAEESLRNSLTQAREHRRELLDRLARDPSNDAGQWQVHGAMLAALDRLLREVDPNQGTQAGGARRGQAEIEPWMAAMRRAARQRIPQSRPRVPPNRPQG